MAQEAEPIVQPSATRVDKALTAQEPQPEPEATPGETPEELLRIRLLPHLWMSFWTHYVADMAAA